MSTFTAVELSKLPVPDLTEQVSFEQSYADLKAILSANGSFSLYMAHGGTTFGLWAGCDRPFQPDTSSYDYDAPISEAGWVGAKFEAYREGLRPFLKSGEVLPPPPPYLDCSELSEVMRFTSSVVFRPYSRRPHAQGDIRAVSVTN